MSIAMPNIDRLQLMFSLKTNKTKDAVEGVRAFDLYSLGTQKRKNDNSTGNDYISDYIGQSRH